MILVLSDLYLPFPGGAERLIYNLARDIRSRGVSVHVLTGYENAQQFDGPPISIEPIGVFDSQPQGAEIVKAYLNDLAPEAVLVHHLYAHQFKNELIASGIPFVQIVLNGERIPEAAFAVHISDWVAERAGFVKDLDLIITPPVFDDVIAETHEHAIGFIKPIAHKGVDLVYDLAVSFPNRKFVVLRGEWQTLEIMSDLPNVEYMEPVKDIRDFYRRVDLVLMPSRSEDAGTVAQECALNRIPCISSNSDGLVQTNAGGVRLDRDDFLGFRRAINELDNDGLRDVVVERQLRYLAEKRQEDVLAGFTWRITNIPPHDPNLITVAQQAKFSS